jgi:hypothetical protein
MTCFRLFLCPLLWSRSLVRRVLLLRVEIHGGRKDGWLATEALRPSLLVGPPNACRIIRDIPLVTNSVGVSIFRLLPSGRLRADDHVRTFHQMMEFLVHPGLVI